MVGTIESWVMPMGTLFMEIVQFIRQELCKLVGSSLPGLEAILLKDILMVDQVELLSMDIA